MSDWNSLESELRKWTPRPPSPELRTRLFSPAPTADAARSVMTGTRFSDFTQWLVPVFGCFLLVIGTLSSRYPSQAVLPLGATNFLGVEAGYTEMVIASRAEQCEKNSLPPARVEWSFGGRSSTGHPGPFPVSYTNKIIQ